MGRTRVAHRCGTPDLPLGLPMYATTCDWWRSRAVNLGKELQGGRLLDRVGPWKQTLKTNRGWTD